MRMAPGLFLPKSFTASAVPKVEIAGPGSTDSIRQRSRQDSHKPRDIPTNGASSISPSVPLSRRSFGAVVLPAYACLRTSAILARKGIGALGLAPGAGSGGLLL